MDNEKSSHFRLYFSNKDEEDDVENELQTFSSADCFKILLKQEIDLNELLRYSSNRAEVTIESFYISSLPLTLTADGNISVLYQMTDDITDQNCMYTRNILQKENEKSCIIHLPNLISTSEQQTLDILNNIMKKGIERSMLFKMLEAYIDRVIFTDKLKYTVLVNDGWGITAEVYKLLLTYLEIADFYRQTYISKIGNLLGSLNPLPPKTYQTSIMSSITESSIISSNQNVFLTVDQIAGDPEIYKMIELSACHGTSLKSQDQRKQLRDSIWTVYRRKHLAPKLTYKRKDPEAEETVLILSDQSLKILTEIRQANLIVYNHSSALHKLLETEAEKAKENSEKRQNQSILTLSSCKLSKKCKFHFKTTECMSSSFDSQLTITFDNHTSHALGSDGNTLSIGPLKYNCETSKRNSQTDPQYSRFIKFHDQTPFFTIRPQPKIIQILSDLVTNLSHHKNGWLKDEGFYPILSLPIGKNNFRRNFVAMSPDHKSHYHVLHKSERILNRFQIVITNESFHKIVFPRKTYVHFCLNVRPR